MCNYLHFEESNHYKGVVMNLKRGKIISLLLASLLIVLAACGTELKSSGIKELKDVTVMDEDVKQIISPNNELGFKIFSEVEKDSNGNIFISPTSLFMALSMVYNGADGETKEEIAKLLETEGITAEELNKSNTALLSTLSKGSNKLQLNIANSIWVNERFHFQEDFAQNNETYFNAEIEGINVFDDGSVEKINNWVKNATNQKIEDIVEAPLDPDLVAILINAIYFKGDWTHAFDEKQTKNTDFYLTNGTTKKVPLMTLSEELGYMENDTFQAVRLPYGDGEMSMQVFLPKEDSSLAEFTETITAENWSVWRAMFEKQEGTILLPKFQLDYEVELKDVLQKLGMDSAFEESRANFAKMIEEDDQIWISKVLQKTFLEVNEQGTEAAAATMIEVVTESSTVHIDPPFYMEVNRPFFITIMDEETGMILFMGVIENPQE